MNSKPTSANEDIVRRLDALIRLYIESIKIANGLTDAAGARVLKSVGLTPSEIAKIFGKKSATDIAPYLYPKKNKK